MLTEKQKAFCDYYIESLNATESYKKAYKNIKNDNTAKAAASRLLTNVNLKSYIDERLKEIQSNRIAKAEEVLEYLTRVIRNEDEEEVVVTVNVGDFQTEVQKVKKEISAKDKIKAAELLGKRYSLFTDKVDVQGDVGVTIIDDIESIEDA